MSELLKLSLDLKQIDVEIDHWKSDTMNIKHELDQEEKSLLSMIKQLELLKTNNCNIENSILSDREALNKARGTRDTQLRNMTSKTFLAQFIDAQEPTQEMQESRLNYANHEFQRSMAVYEKSPTYLMICQEVAEENHLNEFIAELRSELMNLERQLSEVQTSCDLSHS